MNNRLLFPVKYFWFKNANHTIYNKDIQTLCVGCKYTMLAVHFHWIITLYYQLYCNINYIALLYNSSYIDYPELICLHYTNSLKVFIFELQYDWIWRLDSGPSSLFPANFCVHIPWTSLAVYCFNSHAANNAGKLVTSNYSLSVKLRSKLTTFVIIKTKITTITKTKNVVKHLNLREVLCTDFVHRLWDSQLW